MEENRKNQLSNEEQQWLNALLDDTSSSENAIPQEDLPIPGGFDPYTDIQITGEEDISPDFYSQEVFSSYEEAPVQEELGVDESVAYQAGLTHPKDAELEKILSEDWSSVPETEPEEVFVLSPQTQQAEPEETVPETEPTEEPQRKGRPKAKKGTGLFGIPHVLATLVWLALIVAIGVSLGRLIWVCCSDIMAFGKDSQDVIITITEKDDISSVSQKLGKAGLIRYPSLFQLFAELTGKDENITAGTFTLNAHLDYNAMINAMVNYGPSREEVDVMFPEGANCAQIFALLEKNNVCTVADMEAYAAQGELDDYWFLEGVPRGDKYCLEGYLAPDTYTFYTNDEPARVLAKFLDEFDSRFTEKMKESFVALQERFSAMMAENGYNDAYIAENPLTLHQVITLASMVSREASSDAEGYQIASVFYNRLSHPAFPFLDSDATVYYAIGDYFGEVDELTQEHLNTDSPYNTRKYQGLPPGPICNPGVYSLYAALDPDDTDYYFFLYDYNTYSHIFSTTYDEHMGHVKELE